MSDMVTINLPKQILIIPHHEWMRYIDPHIPYEIRLAGTKRGKGYKRFSDSMNRKGSGKHAEHTKQ